MIYTKYSTQRDASLTSLRHHANFKILVRLYAHMYYVCEDSESCKFLRKVAFAVLKILIFILPAYLYLVFYVTT